MLRLDRSMMVPRIQRLTSEPTRETQPWIHGQAGLNRALPCVDVHSPDRSASDRRLNRRCAPGSEVRWLPARRELRRLRSLLGWNADGGVRSLWAVASLWQ